MWEPVLRTVARLTQPFGCQSHAGCSTTFQISSFSIYVKANNARKYAHIKRSHMKPGNPLQSLPKKRATEPKSNHLRENQFPFSEGCLHFFFAHAGASVEKQRSEAFAESCQVPPSPFAHLSWRGNTGFLTVLRNKQKSQCPKGKHGILLCRLSNGLVDKIRKLRFEIVCCHSAAFGFFSLAALEYKTCVASWLTCSFTCVCGRVADTRLRLL